jgi:hypothetical protein
LGQRGVLGGFARELQGVFYPNKISGVGTKFGLLLHVLPGPNKKRVGKPSIVLS